EMRDDLEAHVRALLRVLDPEPEREGLERTPTRVARALESLTRGHGVDPKQVINGALFVEDYSEMIVLKDIDFYSMCEHHVLPFFGKAHVAYLPQHRIIGISKIARLVEVFARRLQVQERMTTQIANTIMEELDPLGVGVVLEAEHLCMRMRGGSRRRGTARCRPPPSSPSSAVRRGRRSGRRSSPRCAIGCRRARRSSSWTTASRGRSGGGRSACSSWRSGGSHRPALAIRRRASSRRSASRSSGSGSRAGSASRWSWPGAGRPRPSGPGAAGLARERPLDAGAALVPPRPRVPCPRLEARSEPRAEQRARPGAPTAVHGAASAARAEGQPDRLEPRWHLRARARAPLSRRRPPSDHARQPPSQPLGDERPALRPPPTPWPGPRGAR